MGKKRIWYNLSVGVSGVLAIGMYARSFGLGEIIGLMVYGVVLNIFYSSGFLIEALNIHYLKQNTRIEMLRIPLFLIGTVMSSMITFMWATIYFAW